MTIDRIKTAGDLEYGATPVERLVLITLDSCRYDTAELADVPFLESIGPLRRAWAHGTFTLPAHAALFHGYAPVPTGPDTWHSAHTRPLGRLPAYARWGKTGPAARGTVDGANLIDALRHDGFYTLGCAGMRWFMVGQLQTGFTDFIYWGPKYSQGDHDLPTWAPADFALNHPEELVAKVKAHNRWILFINAAETHAPYMADRGLLAEMRAQAHFRNGKATIPATLRPLMGRLHDAQVHSLEVASRRIERLFDLLPGPFDYLVTADHGEAFGESDLWGHVHADPSVMEVPLWEGRYGNS